MGDRVRTKWTERWGWGYCAPFRGRKLGPHLTQFRLGRGLPPYKVPSWSIQPFGQSKHGPKIGGAVPFLGGYLGPSPYNTMSPGPRPTSIASGILTHHRYRQTYRQRSDSIERTVLQTVAENPVNVRYSTQSSLRQLRCIHSFMRSFIITYVYTSTICKWDSRTLRITCSSPGGGLT